MRINQNQLAEIHSFITDFQVFLSSHPLVEMAGDQTIFVVCGGAIFELQYSSSNQIIEIVNVKALNNEG